MSKWKDANDEAYLYQAIQTEAAITQCDDAREKLRAVGFKIPEPTNRYNARELQLRLPFKEQLPAVRRALGCPLEMSYKNIADDGKSVDVIFMPRDYEHVRITFNVPLRGKKCKIVTEMRPTTRLVCNV